MLTARGTVGEGRRRQDGFRFSGVVEFLRWLGAGCAKVRRNRVVGVAFGLRMELGAKMCRKLLRVVSRDQSLKYPKCVQQYGPS